MKILVTGAAGFIGFHLVKRLVRERFQIVGLDAINSYYDVNLKYARLQQTGIKRADADSESLAYSALHPNYRFLKMDLVNKKGLLQLFRTERFDLVMHLAAQAGVRYSLENPDAYIKSNIEGYLNILEACRRYPVSHLIYASSSSVYGDNKKTPFSVDDTVDKPVSLYAATKKSNELMAYTYSHLYRIPVTGLRFFTVYGPWGRPDMAPSLFADAICAGDPIQIFNQGDMERDFTYVDDIVEGVFRLLQLPPTEHPPYALHNIGNSKPIKLLDFVRTLEFYLSRKAEKKFLPMQPGDVKKTWADIRSLQQTIEYSPQTTLDQGISKFISWYLEYTKQK